MRVLSIHITTKVIKEEQQIKEVVGHSQFITA